MTKHGKKLFLIIFCLSVIVPAASVAGYNAVSNYSLSFIVQPSDVVAGSYVFASTALRHPSRGLIRSNAVQFRVYDQNNNLVPGTSVVPVTTDSRGLAVYVYTILRPGNGYSLVASCYNSVIRSRPFDVLPQFVPDERDSAVLAASVPEAVMPLPERRVAKAKPVRAQSAPKKTRAAAKTKTRKRSQPATQPQQDAVLDELVLPAEPLLVVKPEPLPDLREIVVQEPPLATYAVIRPQPQPSVTTRVVLEATPMPEALLAKVVTTVPVPDMPDLPALEIDEPVPHFIKPAPMPPVQFANLVARILRSER